MTLQAVLHVPKIRCNLISVSMLRKDLNCVVIFFPSHYELQDLNSGRMIDRAEE